MSGPRGVTIRAFSSNTFVTGPTGTRIQVIDYNTVRTKLNGRKKLEPDERAFVVDNEARFAKDMDCNSSCKDAVAVIHIKGSGRTRHARRRKTRGRRSTRRGARASRKRPTR